MKWEEWKKLYGSIWADRWGGNFCGSFKWGFTSPLLLDPLSYQSQKSRSTQSHINHLCQNLTLLSATAFRWDPFCRETIKYYVCSVDSIFLYFHIFHPDEANQARDPCNVLVVFPNNGAQTPCAILSYLKVFLFQIVSLNWTKHVKNISWRQTLEFGSLVWNSVKFLLFNFCYNRNKNIDDML